MLWKYKKVYQEVNKETPEVTTCYKLVRVRFVQPSTPEFEIYNFKYKRCADLSTVNYDIQEGIAISVNECIAINTLKVNNVDINLTLQEVADAILNNSGEIIKPISDFSVTPAILLGSFSFIFDDCDTPPAQYTFYIRNNSSSAVITDYNVLFTYLLVNTPPLSPSQFDFGQAGNISSGSLEIDVSGVSPGNNLQVLINAVSVQTIPTPTDGVYTISGITKNINDILDIILV